MKKKSPPPEHQGTLPWVPEGNDRARVDGVEQEALSLKEWLAAGGERRRQPRGPQWEATEPLGLDPLAGED